MWNWNLIFPWRWFSKKETSAAAPITRGSAVNTQRRNPEHYRSNTHYRAKYYRRDGNYYSTDDDSLIEDLILIALLANVFDSADADTSETNEPETNIEEDIAAIDVAAEEVRKAYVEPESYAAPEPEPSRNYVGDGSDYDGGGSDYDGGGSDSSYD